MLTIKEWLEKYENATMFWLAWAVVWRWFVIYILACLTVVFFVLLADAI